MDLKVLIFLVTSLLFSRSTIQATTPEDRCRISESGSVCIDCFSRGNCLLNEEDETYTVTFESKCPSDPIPFYCDDTISSPQDFGSCSRLSTTATNCRCSSSTRCIADVNNPAVILHCEDNTPLTDPPCLFPSLDLETCSCASLDESCLFIDDPNDDCSSYFISIEDKLIPARCADTLCFDQESCGCVISEKAMTGTLKATPEPMECLFVDDPTGDCGSYFIDIGGTFTPIKCGPGICFNQESCHCVVPDDTMCSSCPFIDDPNDSCQSYFICGGDVLPRAVCTGDLCFDQEQCGCVVREEISTEQSTTITLSPPTCSYVDDPNDDCGSYFEYDGTKFIPHSCEGTLCFNEDACGCIEPLPMCEDITGSCLFVDDPNDNCKSYYVCSGNGPIRVDCPGSLCFDQESCACVLATESPTIEPSTDSSSTDLSVTTPSPTCPPGCPFTDDPNDSCKSYFVCTTNGLTQINCTGTLCFDQESCGCVPAPAPPSTTEAMTIPPTCPPGCPLLDDPSDNCTSYFVCTGAGWTKANCSDNLCFDQESCGCVPAPTTEMTTMPTTCPPGCPFLDDPNDNCTSYFVCAATGITPINCSENLCFDQKKCGCVPAPAPATETTTAITSTSTSITTCPPGCPFVDDPKDNCESYFLCNGKQLISLTCADELCFDQESCACIDKTLVPTAPTTCSDDCPFLDDPNDDCKSYFLCYGTEMIPQTCADDLCFEQASCACVIKALAEPLTTPLSITTCPSECPYIDDPFDDCENFYYCVEGFLYPYQCPKSLCFDASMCQCH